MPSPWELPVHPRSSCPAGQRWMRPGVAGTQRHGIHNDGQVQAGPCLEQPGGLPVADDDPDTRKVLGLPVVMTA